ncbi:class I SAM-dependent methyltransferase [Methylocystis echinoides]|uniref:class I SAM-dependent methyltransferase n=1 Tax=Methylocystis echinoides TaxID=29468 RepID=UPI003436B8B9
MHDQYERIAHAYREARKAPMSLFLEAPSVLKAIGNLEGKRAIDFACGEGFYTRMLKGRGASVVVGIDLSPQMIELAEEEERRAPLGVSYFVADVAEKPKFGAFDLATAIFLFNYAEDVDALDNMVSGVFENLAPNGRLLAVVPNPAFVNGRKDTLPYGYFVEELERGSCGARFKMTFYGASEFSIECMQWDRPTYEAALARNGFSSIEWMPFEVTPEGLCAFGEAFWDAALTNPKSIILSAIKAS